MITEAIQATNDLVRIVPFLGGSTDKRDYEQALELVEYLVEHQPDSPLVEILSDKVARYENSALSSLRLTRVLMLFRAE